MKGSRATARTNIALVKYWGKISTEENLPATGSISMTLSGFSTTTEVLFLDKSQEDEIFLNGKPAGEADRVRIGTFLNRVRVLAGSHAHAKIVSENNFPTAGGLASSASGFAALTLAATRAAGLELDTSELARLARLGSGSAPRSLLGGYVELGLPSGATPSQYSITQLAGQDDLDLRLVVAVTGMEAKKTGSTEGMERSRLTSPYYNCWISTHAADLDRARLAIRERDFNSLGEAMEASCWKMHAVIMTSVPSILYWKPATVAAIKKVTALRDEGLEGYITIDAGPHVKVLCKPKQAEIFRSELAQVPGVEGVFIERPGAGAGPS